MLVAIHRKSLILGLLNVLASVGGACLYICGESKPLEPSGYTGKQLFLLIFAPLILGGCVYFIGRGVRRSWLAATRYILTPADLTIRAPVGTRIVAWRDVTGFLLLPAHFPAPPETLVLLLGEHGRVNIPVRRFIEAGADPILTAATPGLAEYGLDRVRLPPPQTLSAWQVRWKLYHRDLPMLLGLSILMFFLLLGIAAMSWNYVNYRRIVGNHLSAQAEITRIDVTTDKDDESVHARVRFTAWDGQPIRFRRHVFLTFADKFKVGDHVTVDYLRDKPWIGRIPGWDLDQSEWLLGLLVAPMFLLLIPALLRGVGRWVWCLRERLVWAPIPAGHCVVISEAGLDVMAEIFPDRHRGVLILKPVSAKKQAAALNVTARRLAKAGIDAIESLGKLLVLGPEQAQRLLGRYGGTGRFEGGYMVLDCPTTQDAQRILMGEFQATQEGRPKAGATPVPEVRFYSLEGAVGPLAPQDLSPLWAAWVDYRLARLYGGELPGEVPRVDLVELLELDLSANVYFVMVERRSSGPRVWVRNVNENRADRADCIAGLWSVTRDCPVPWPLKKRWRNRKTPAAPAVEGGWRR